MNAKILVVLPTSNFLHRQILEGILEYAKTNGPWQFHLVTGDDFEQGLQATERWGATGYIALVRETAQMKRLFDRKLPGIFLNPPSPLGGRSKAEPPRRTIFVNRDQEGVGQTAADYFLERHFTNFAFVGVGRRPTGNVAIQRRLDSSTSPPLALNVTVTDETSSDTRVPDGTHVVQTSPADSTPVGTVTPAIDTASIPTAPDVLQTRIWSNPP